MFVICGLIVFLFPKIENFKYSFQKGMLWKYETLNAPFDFPIHKTVEELKEEVEHIRREQPPIFVFNANVLPGQLKQLNERVNRFRTGKNETQINQFVEKFKEIYEKGIILMPARLSEKEVKSVLIIRDNIAREEKMEDVLRCVVHLPHAWADRPWEYLRKAVMPMARAMMHPAERLVMLPAIARFAEKLEKGEIG